MVVFAVVALRVIMQGGRALPRPVFERLDVLPPDDDREFRAITAQLEDLGFRKGGLYRADAMEPMPRIVQQTFMAFLLAPDRRSEAAVVVIRSLALTEGASAGPARVRWWLRSFADDGRVVVTSPAREISLFPRLPLLL